jgi:HNH endonuclease
MITVPLSDLVAFGVLALTLLVLLDRQLLLRELRKTRHEVKALRKALNTQGKPTRRGSIPVWLRQRVIERCEYQCQYCGGYGDEQNGPDGRPWHVDHVVPVSKGGPTHDGNLTLSCEACNLGKHNRPAFEINGGARDVAGEPEPIEEEQVEVSAPVAVEEIDSVLVPQDEESTDPAVMRHIYATYLRLGRNYKAAEREIYEQDGGVKFYWVRKAVEWCEAKQ